MHIPAYAYATIQAALPTAPLPSQVPGANCCLCDMPFRGGVRVPLNAFTESDLEACRPCLTRLVAQARRLRDNAFTEETNRIRAELAEWKVTQDRHVASIERVRQAADAVTQLLDEDDIAPPGSTCRWNPRTRGSQKITRHRLAPPTRPILLREKLKPGYSLQ
jgi:hypothetical protein